MWNNFETRNLHILYNTHTHTYVCCVYKQNAHPQYVAVCFRHTCASRCCVLLVVVIVTVIFLSKFVTRWTVTMKMTTTTTIATISQMLGKGTCVRKLPQKMGKKSNNMRTRCTRWDEGQREKENLVFTCYYWHIWTCLLCGRHVFI